jgi:ATP-dependent helicase/nuclease subunit A
MPLAPSRLAPLETDDEGEPVAPPPDPHAEPRRTPVHTRADGPRFLRGTLTHALLNYLPALPDASRADAAAAFLELRGRELKPASRRSIVKETLAVLRHPEFAPIFGPRSRAEVPIVADIIGPNGGVVRVNGQIDRLVRLENEVLIVDYKTNRPPPRRAEDVAETYLLQLAAYRLAVSRVFPGLPVKAALLWTDGADLMPIPTARLDEAEARLFTLSAAQTRVS